jgi:hypothetical protein
VAHWGLSRQKQTNSKYQLGNLVASETTLGKIPRFGTISQQAAVHPWLAADAHGNKQTRYPVAIGNEVVTSVEQEQDRPEL